MSVYEFMQDVLWKDLVLGDGMIEGGQVILGLGECFRGKLHSDLTYV